ERRAGIGIGNHDQSAVILAALREIAGPLKRRGRVPVLRSATDKLARVFLAPEEKELLLFLIENPRDEHRTADAIGFHVEAVRGYLGIWHVEGIAAVAVVAP